MFSRHSKMVRALTSVALLSALFVAGGAARAGATTQSSGTMTCRETNVYFGMPQTLALSFTAGAPTAASYQRVDWWVGVAPHTETYGDGLLSWSQPMYAFGSTNAYYSWTGSSYAYHAGPQMSANEDSWGNTVDVFYYYQLDNWNGSSWVPAGYHVKFKSTVRSTGYSCSATSWSVVA